MIHYNEVKTFIETYHRNPSKYVDSGRLDVILLGEANEGELKEIERFQLCPTEGRFGCIVPKGAWHTVEVIEPSVIYEAKDGKYGEDAPHSLSFRLSVAHGEIS